MPKAPPPAKEMRFQGRLAFPIEQEVDDWGLTPTQQESYVEQFRRILAAKNAWKEEEHDYYKLRRFLRARTYDLEKATTMWMNHLAWRQEYSVDTILQDFVFHEKDKFLQTYPQGYHKTDKLGRPVYIQSIGKIDMAAIKRITTEERMLRFHIQEYERCVKVVMPICSTLQHRNIDTTFGIMDVKGVGLSHLTGEVKRLLGIITKTDQDNYPEMLGHICIINAPAVFRMLWAAIKGMLDARTQTKIEILGPDYTRALLNWVEPQNLPIFLGGQSEGTLFDDIGPWSDPNTLQKLGINPEQLRLPPSSRTPSVSGGEGPSALGAAGGAAAVLALGNSSTLMQRQSSEASETGYFSPTCSSSDIGASMGRNASLQQHLMEANGTIPERPKTLVDRISAIERLLPEQARRLRTQQGQGINGDVSTKSTIEGSLLHRVEVLEEALESLLAAQEAALVQAQQQQDVATRQLAPPPLPPPRHRGCCGCCVQ